MTQERLKFLEFIQNIVARMNSNAMHIKTMCIAVVSAIFVIYATNKNAQIILISFVPLVLCCFLDMYYLWQERRFIALYEDTLKSNSKIQDFDLSGFINYHKGFKSYLKVFLSCVIWTFYGVIAVCILVLWSIL